MQVVEVEDEAGSRAGEPRGQVNESRGQAEAPMVLNTGETADVG